MPESFLSAPLIPDELELCFKSHPSLRVISFLPNSLHWGASHRMALASLVFVRIYVPFQLSRRSKCLHSFCGSQISQNLTHFHYSRPHHPTSHPEIIQSPEVTHTRLIPQPPSLRPSSAQNVWLLSTSSYTLCLQPKAGLKPCVLWRSLLKASLPMSEIVFLISFYFRACNSYLFYCFFFLQKDL